MLLGEYAVLHGKHALVCAVNKRITVTLTPRDDKRIEINSIALGSLTSDITKLKVASPFQFVLATLKHFQKQLSTGCSITIESEFSDKVGLGSSAAVTIATLAAISAWLNLSLSPADLIMTGRTIIRKVQNLGSGADVAACVLGGMVAYRARPFLAEKINSVYPITIMYSGYKTPTVEAVKHVKKSFADYPKVLKHLFNAINACAVEGIHAARHDEWAAFTKVFDIQQGLMEALGVSTPFLTGLINELREQPGIQAAKISGSGLGDCVIGLGIALSSYVPTSSAVGASLISAEMTAAGVTCEQI